MGIPCFLGGMARGMLGRDSPIHIRQNRRDALKEADLVVLAGKELHPATLQSLGVSVSCFVGNIVWRGWNDNF